MPGAVRRALVSRYPNGRSRCTVLVTVGLPQLQLTPDEKRFWSEYSAPGKPGVRARVTPLQLVETGIAGEQNVPSQTFTPNGRKARVGAVTFTGDLSYWDLRIKLGSGQLLIADFARVSALVNVPFFSGSSTQPDDLVSDFILARVQGDPFIFDPGIDLQGNESLVFDGAFVPGIGGARSVLNIAVHWWDFLPRA